MVNSLSVHASNDAGRITHYPQLARPATDILKSFDAAAIPW
ncbi:hypothetical protein [Mycobacterium gastri]|nr:hypothetical protein [Mycobacterium gastri]ETW21268.1 hypothetical protein MGAST_26865 [Mycobacterium gastri 'Wayne']